ncbi:phosphonate C-P lyase system protein PhnG [Saccharopolyspora pogona]|uniref:phosphonate C-P lyase system protein PhnG n=1 Tax=Saccharopolyspora pogona TaxID=333966 RepID=UPI001685D37B|nr:phosphonate C-P lyase system protein PhnG [Saccharopolyspora pogona]
MTEVLSREQRCALLAEAERDELVALADECLDDGAALRVLSGPEVGIVVAQVREPVLAERFLLGDVLACRVEVDLAGQVGWSIRLGEDRVAAVAAAVLDAEAEADRPRSARVDELCRTVADRLAAREVAEWAALAPTIVEFEELT